MDVKRYCCANFTCNYAFSNVYGKLTTEQQNETKMTLNTMVIHCHIVESIIYYLFDNDCKYNVNSIVNYLCNNVMLMSEVLSFIIKNHRHYYSQLVPFDLYINESIERMYDFDSTYLDVLYETKKPLPLKQKVNYDVKRLVETSSMQLKCELMYKKFSELCEKKKFLNASKWFHKKSMAQSSSFKYLLNYLIENNKEQLYFQQIHKMKPYLSLEDVENYDIKDMLTYSQTVEYELYLHLNESSSITDDQDLKVLLQIYIYCYQRSENEFTQLEDYQTDSSLDLQMTFTK